MSDIPTHRVVKSNSQSENERLKRASGDMPLINGKIEGDPAAENQAVYEDLDGKGIQKEGYVLEVETPLAEIREGAKGLHMPPLKLYNKLCEIENRQKWLNIANYIQLLRRHKSKNEATINLRKVSMPIQASATIRPVTDDEFDRLQTINNWKTTQMVEHVQEHVKVIYTGDNSEVEIVAKKV